MFIIVNVYNYVRKSKRYSYLKISPPKAPCLSPIPFIEFINVKVKWKRKSKREFPIVNFYLFASFLHRA